MFQISYDYSYKCPATGEWRTLTNNLVGRDGQTPIGYGPVGPPSLFWVEELPEIIRILTEQLGTIPTLHLHPRPY